MTTEDFPLPSLGPRLVAFREEVSRGRGFQLFRCGHPLQPHIPPRIVPVFYWSYAAVRPTDSSALACRGVPVQRYSRQETMIAYWGIGTYWGKAQSNNKKGHLIGHVRCTSPHSCT